MRETPITSKCFGQGRRIKSSAPNTRPRVSCVGFRRVDPGTSASTASGCGRKSRWRGRNPRRRPPRRATAPGCQLANLVGTFYTRVRNAGEVIQDRFRRFFLFALGNGCEARRNNLRRSAAIQFPAISPVPLSNGDRSEIGCDTPANRAEKE